MRGGASLALVSPDGYVRELVTSTELVTAEPLHLQPPSGQPINTCLGLRTLHAVYVVDPLTVMSQSPNGELMAREGDFLIQVLSP